MTDREHRIAVIAFTAAAFGGLAVGLIAQPLSLDGITTIKAGEWLQAAAGFAGAIATVAAAVFIEHYRRSLDQRAELSPLRDCLTQIQYYVKTASELPNIQEKDAVFGYRAILSLLLSMRGLFDAVRQTKRPSAKLYSTLEGVNKAFEALAEAQAQATQVENESPVQAKQSLYSTFAGGVMLLNMCLNMALSELEHKI